MKKIIHRGQRYKTFGGYTQKRFAKKPSGLSGELHTPSIPLPDLDLFKSRSQAHRAEYKRQWRLKRLGRAIGVSTRDNGTQKDITP